MIIAECEGRRRSPGIRRGLLAPLLCFTLFAAGTGSAQNGPDRQPRRPRLAREADTNSAAAYYSFGMDQLERNAEDAAGAFYWAARLDPTNPQALYGRWVALLLDDPSLLRTYFEDPRGARRSTQIRRIDALRAEAALRDPFLREDLNGVLVTSYVEHVATTEQRLSGEQVSSTELHYWVGVYLHSHDVDPELSAWLAASEGNFPVALRTWAELAQRKPRSSWVHAERARVFFRTGRLDSARVEMSRALDIARQHDADSTRFTYESKAAWLFSLGRVFSGLGNDSAAREAYEGALNEDLTYFPAHLQLGQLHFARGDTAAALREFSRAVEASADEFQPHATYGYYLGLTGHADSAAIHLRRAIEIEPFCATPRLMLAVVLDQSRDAVGALEAYEQFLARAARDDPNLNRVHQRVAQLRGSTPIR